MNSYTLPDAGGGLEVCMVSVTSVRYNGQQNYYLPNAENFTAVAMYIIMGGLYIDYMLQHLMRK